jgi:hypothetical protein
VAGTVYYLCSILDGCSRSIVHWEIRESMKEADIERLIERARELHPGVAPRIISDNGPQFIANDFKHYIRLTGMTHVRTSPHNPAVPRKRVFALPHPTPDGSIPHPAIEIPGGVALSTEQLAWIHSMFERLDREAHGAKVKGALSLRKARGQVVGQVPYGWRRDGDVLVEIPEEQAAIQRMIVLRELGETPARITQALQREGFPPRGKRWYQTSVQNILGAADARAAEPAPQPLN